MWSKVKPFLTEYHNYSAYLVGSRSLPWIKHPNDWDIVILTASDQDSEQLREEWVNSGGEEGLDLHIYPLSRMAEQTRQGTWSYLVHYAQLLQGESVMHIDIFDPTLRPKIYKFIGSIINESKGIVRRKVYYHIYTTLAMWKNGKYWLTEDDKEIVNRFHDYENNEEDYELMLQMFKEVKDGNS